MIKRYTTDHMGKIWCDENKYKTWLKVEITVLEILCEDGLVPLDDLKKIKKMAKFSVERILEIEKTTHHDVIAFLTNLSEEIGPASRHIHMGMTSSDLLDTSLALLCKESGEIIKAKLEKFYQVLIMGAKKYKHTFQIGRSHGVHAEPITFGLKLALWSEEIKRHINRFEAALHDISFGKLSGAVGTFQHLDPSVEVRVCKKLGLQFSTVSNQVVQRDHHASFLSSLALIGCTIEKIAVEIRHLQRTEVFEVEEYFAKGQKGSSAMPHKRNPIITERLTGFSRLLRSNSLAAMENVALWHERDISHSSVERIIIPDSLNLLEYMLIKISMLFEKLIVYPDNMKRNLELTNGLIFSQEVLLELINKGLTREKAYSLVQKNAMESWDKKVNFKKLIQSDKEILSILDNQEIESLFDLDKTLINVDKIFDRIGLK